MHQRSGPKPMRPIESPRIQPDQVTTQTSQRMDPGMRQSPSKSAKALGQTMGDDMENRILSHFELLDKRCVWHPGS